MRALPLLLLLAAPLRAAVPAEELAALFELVMEQGVSAGAGDSIVLEGEDGEGALRVVAVSAPQEEPGGFTRAVYTRSYTHLSVERQTLSPMQAGVLRSEIRVYLFAFDGAPLKAALSTAPVDAQTRALVGRPLDKPLPLEDAARAWAELRPRLMRLRRTLSI